MIIGISDYVRPPFDIEAKALGEGIEFVDFNSRIEEDINVARLESLDALLVWHAPITRRTIQHLDNCKIVVRYGVGYDNICLEALKEHGIPLCNTPDYGVEEVANTAAGLILNLWRKVSAYDLACREFTEGWMEHVLKPMGRISESTLGVIGVGRIGTALIHRMKPFGCRILGYDPDQPSGHERAIGYRRTATLEELLRESDVVSLHCTLTGETTDMVDEGFVAAMKPGAVLVNTARGRLVKNLDVIEEGLRSGRIGAAGLDVLPEEPPGDHPLIRAWRSFEPWLKGRLIITPHTAYYSDAAWHEMRYKAATTVRLYLEKSELRNRIV